MDGIATGRKLVSTQRVYLNSQQRINKGIGDDNNGASLSNCEYQIEAGLIHCKDDEVLSVALVHFGCSSTMMMFGPDPVHLYCLGGAAESQIFTITLNSSPTNMVYRGMTNDAFCEMMTANIPTVDVSGTVLTPYHIDTSFGVIPNTNINAPSNCNWLCDLNTTTAFEPIYFITPGPVTYFGVEYEGTSPLFAKAIGLPSTTDVKHSSNTVSLAGVPNFTFTGPLIQCNSAQLDPGYEHATQGALPFGTLYAPMDVSGPNNLLMTTNFPTESYCHSIKSGRVLASIPLIANKIQYDPAAGEWSYNFLYTNTAILGAHKPVGSINPDLLTIGLRLEDGSDAHLAGHDYDFCLEFKILARSK